MSDQTIDAFARRAAAAVSRRNSVLTLGVAALAASLAAPGRTSAKPGKKKGNQKCRRQAEQCREGVEELIETLAPNPSQQRDQAIEDFQECCEALRGCNAAAAFECAIEVAEVLDT